MARAEIVYDEVPEYVDITQCGDAKQELLLVGYTKVQRAELLVCNFCGSRNDRRAHQCTQCGAPL